MINIRREILVSKLKKHVSFYYYVIKCDDSRVYRRNENIREIVCINDNSAESTVFEIIVITDMAMTIDVEIEVFANDQLVFILIKKKNTLIVIKREYFNNYMDVVFKEVIKNV